MAAMILLLASCADQWDLLAETPRPAFTHDGEALGVILVELGSDKRPPLEHGASLYPGESWLTSDALLEPTDVALLRILARDLKNTGLASKASLRQTNPDYRVRVGILNLGAATDEGFSSIALVLPTTSVTARVRIHVALIDQSGRRFLSKEYSAESNAHTVPLAGSESLSVDLLAETFRAVLDQVLPELAPSVAAFWKEIENLKPAREVSPRPE